MTDTNSPEYMRKLMESVELDEFFGSTKSAGDRKWFIRIEYKDKTIDDQGPFESEEAAEEAKMKAAMEHDHDRTGGELKNIRVLQRQPDWLEIPAPQRK